MPKYPLLDNLRITDHMRIEAHICIDECHMLILPFLSDYVQLHTVGLHLGFHSALRNAYTCEPTYFPVRHRIQCAVFSLLNKPECVLLIVINVMINLQMYFVHRQHRG